MSGLPDDSLILRMNFRTIEEAKALPWPKVPESIAKDVQALDMRLPFSNESSIGKLRKIYAISDKVTSIFAENAVCREGCSFCCKNGVAITELEARYIQTSIGVDIDKGSSVTLRQDSEGTPCGFLTNLRGCSIYASRPFACRTVLTFDDPRYCAEPNMGHVFFMSKDEKLIDVIFHLIVKLNGNGLIRDIRDFFPKKA